LGNNKGLTVQWVNEQLNADMGWRHTVGGDENEQGDAVRRERNQFPGRYLL